MVVSTKGRYALCVLIDLAEHQNGSYISLKEVAERQEISEKYLESILKVLVQDKLLKGLRGKGGGYKLSLSPEQITVGRVLRLTESVLAPSICVGDGTDKCPKMSVCRTAPLWKNLDDLINNYLDSISLADLMRSQEAGYDYVI